MPRPPRRDEPGAWHHVMNRGIARRTAFEDRRCIRFFLSRIAYATRRLELEVHAFTVLSTHFHLLVRSPNGRMAEGMRRIQNEYVRWFNRRSRRDGPLFRGRFCSRRVDSLRYRQLLVGYIDHNPVLAGLAATPEAYAHGSARHYAHRTAPPWLDESWIRSDCLERFGSEHDSWEAYRRAYLQQDREGTREFVEQRLHHPALEVDPLDDLVTSSPEKVLLWMRRKAELADGTRPGIPCVSAREVSCKCKAYRDAGLYSASVGRSAQVTGAEAIEIGLLRDLSGLRWSEIAQRIKSSPSAAKRRYAAYRAQVLSDASYAALAQQVVVELLGVGSGRRILS